MSQISSTYPVGTVGKRSVEPARSAQRVVEGVQAQGVQHIFGVPGAKVDEIYDVLAGEGSQLIVCRHEQNAVFIAAGIGRLTGTPGVVLVTSGPGTTNLATGLVTANTEGDPWWRCAGYPATAASSTAPWNWRPPRGWDRRCDHA